MVKKPLFDKVKSMYSLKQLRQQIIGIDEVLETPFGQRRMVYADYTASGRGMHFIENYLLHIQKRYANSHTEDDTTGRITTELLHHAEDTIKRLVNAGNDGRIIMCGSGATAAIDRVQQLVGVKLPAASRTIIDSLLQNYFGKEQTKAFTENIQQTQPVIFVGPYEHHSNEVSWREGLATVVEVNLTPEGEIDLNHLEQLLQKKEYQNRLRIGSFSAASNVTGIKSPVHEIAGLLHQYDALVFIDFAASAPYVNINMNPKSENGLDTSLDAIFISPHKFVGGPGSSGVLVFNRRIYHPELSPSIAGGGTVDYVGPSSHDFIEDIEERESAGTPAILQTLKAALVFELKDSIGLDIIHKREHELTAQAMQRWQAHNNIEILGNPNAEKRVGIFSFNIKGKNGLYLHPRFVTALLDDLFGIQSRAGCSCAGPYGHSLLNIKQEQADEYREVIAEGTCGIKPGWCRIGFHYLFDDAEANYIIDAVEFIADYGYLFLTSYQFDSDSGLWANKNSKPSSTELSIQAAINSNPISITKVSEKERAEHYQNNLELAQQYAKQLSSTENTVPLKLEGKAGDVQFFMLSGDSLID